MSAQAWLAILLAIAAESLIAWLAWGTGNGTVVLAVVGLLTVAGCWLMAKALREGV